MGFASPPSPSAAYGMVAFGFVTTLSRSHRFFNWRSEKLGFSRSRCQYFGDKNNLMWSGLYNRIWRGSSASTSSSNTSIYCQSQHKGLVSGWPLSVCWFRRIFTSLWRTITRFCSECSTDQGNIIELLMKLFTRGLRVNCLWVTNGPVQIQKLLNKIVIGKKATFIIAILNPHFAERT